MRVIIVLLLALLSIAFAEELVDLDNGTQKEVPEAEAKVDNDDSDKAKRKLQGGYYAGAGGYQQQWGPYQGGYQGGGGYWGGWQGQGGGWGHPGNYWGGYPGGYWGGYPGGYWGGYPGGYWGGYPGWQGNWQGNWYPQQNWGWQNQGRPYQGPQQQPYSSSKGGYDYGY